MPKTPDDRLARALRENLKRRKAGTRKAGLEAGNDAPERLLGEDPSKKPVAPVRPNTAEKKT